jgi:hypothetical protein
MKRQKITSVGKDLEKKEALFTVGRKINYSHYGKQYGGNSKKLRIELPYDDRVYIQRK